MIDETGRIPTNTRGYAAIGNFSAEVPETRRAGFILSAPAAAIRRMAINRFRQLS
jgi:hypothetical protein